MARTKKTVTIGVTQEQLDKAMIDYTVAEVKIDQMNAAMNEKISKIRDMFVGGINQAMADKEDAYNIVQTYALENREELFQKKKSRDHLHGVFGFRTGTPKLKTRKGFTWSAVLELLKLKAAQYVRIKEDVAKDVLLATRDDESIKALMEAVGVEVVQDETFYIETKKENANEQ